MKIELEGLASVLAPVVACATLTCSPSTAPPVTRVELAEDPSVTAGRRAVILVALDGVRWQEVFEGVDPELAERSGIPERSGEPPDVLVPNITRLMRAGGAIGAPGFGPPMVASGPNFVSLPGYREMLSGRSDTGCRDNACERISSSTVVDDVAHSGVGRAAVVTSWPDIERAAAAFPGDADMSVGRHGGSRRAEFESNAMTRAFLRVGEGAGPEPGCDDFRNDVRTADLALAYFRSTHPAFLFVGLGETDEFAHHEDYRGYLGALHRADEAIGHFADFALNPSESALAVTLLVTTDHGRSKAFASHGSEYPESARVWLVAAGPGIPAKGPTRSPEVRRLANVAPTIATLLGIPTRKGTEAPLAELFEPARAHEEHASSN